MERDSLCIFWYIYIYTYIYTPCNHITNVLPSHHNIQALVKQFWRERTDKHSCLQIDAPGKNGSKVSQASDFWLKLQNGLTRLTSGPKSLLEMSILFKHGCCLVFVWCNPCKEIFLFASFDSPSKQVYCFQNPSPIPESPPSPMHNAWGGFTVKWPPWCAAHEVQRRHLFTRLWMGWNARSTWIIGMADIPLAQGYFSIPTGWNY